MWDQQSYRVLKVRQSELLHQASRNLEAAAVCSRRMRDPKGAAIILRVRSHVGELESQIGAQVIHNAVAVLLDDDNEG